MQRQDSHRVDSIDLKMRPEPAHRRRQRVLVVPGQPDQAARSAGRQAEPADLGFGFLIFAFRFAIGALRLHQRRKALPLDRPPGGIHHQHCTAGRHRPAKRSHEPAGIPFFHDDRVTAGPPGSGSEPAR